MCICIYIVLKEQQFMDDGQVFFRFIDRPIPDSAKLLLRASSPLGRGEFRRTQV